MPFTVLEALVPFCLSAILLDPSMLVNPFLLSLGGQQSSLQTAEPVSAGSLSQHSQHVPANHGLRASGTKIMQNMKSSFWLWGQFAEDGVLRTVVTVAGSRV